MKNVTEKSCPECGKAFTSFRKFCSDECRDTRTCKRCGKKFRSASGKEKFCSDACRVTKPLPAWQQKRVCYCGYAFTPATPGQTACSPAHAKELRRQYQADYYQNRKAGFLD